MASLYNYVRKPKELIYPNNYGSVCPICDCWYLYLVDKTDGSELWECQECKYREQR